MSIKDTFAKSRWIRSQNKVNKAVSVFAGYGLTYSRTDGIIGNTRSLTKKDNRKITAAATIMNRNKAGFYRDTQKFTKTTDLKPVRYAPLKFADYVDVQEKAFRQANSSMHLRAGIKSIQRPNYDPRLQAHPNRRVLSLSPDDAQEWAANVESLWRDDKELKDWSEDLKNNYPQVADMALWSYQSIGEFFLIRRPYFDKDDRLTNISLQLISPFQIQSPFFAPGFRIFTHNKTCPEGIFQVDSNEFLADLPKGNYIEAGIEYNSKNQEVSIFIAPATFGAPWIRIPIKNSTGFAQVLHGYMQQNPGDNRGIPESSSAWHEFMNIKDLAQFELESARLNTVIAGTVTADSNAQPNGTKPVGELGSSPAGWDINGPIAPLEPYTDPGYSVRQVESGGFVIQNFTPGYKYSELTTARPNVKIPEFIDKLLNYIYPSVYGMSRSVVALDLEGSYNASKGKIDFSWKNGIEYVLKQFTSDFHRPNYRAWLAGKVATGEVPAPGWEEPRKKNAWSSMSIITPPKPSLNPAAESLASKNRIEQGISNREFESQQSTGTSAEENAERLRTENEKLAIANAPLVPVPVQGGNTGE